MQDGPRMQRPSGAAQVWSHLARQWDTLRSGKQVASRNQKIAWYQEDCNNNINQNHNLTIPHHQKNDETVRVVTYNVHFWADPKSNPNFDAILQVIQELNADILILQEVFWGPAWSNRGMTRDQIKEAFKALGYKNFLFGQAATLANAPFGNVIISKYPLLPQFLDKAFVYSAKPARCEEERCFVKAVIKLPNDKSMTVYGTHLDVYDETGKVRHHQIEELLENMKNFRYHSALGLRMQAESGFPSPIPVDYPCNIVIAADFNEVRRQDCSYGVFSSVPVWNLIAQDFKTRNPGLDIPLNVAASLARENFSDCFTLMLKDQASHYMPRFTTWNGTCIDFIYLSQNWQLPIEWCGVKYTAASDHLPVIMDVRVDN